MLFEIILVGARPLLPLQIRPCCDYVSWHVGLASPAAVNKILFTYLLTYCIHPGIKVNPCR